MSPDVPSSSGSGSTEQPSPVIAAARSSKRAEGAKVPYAPRRAAGTVDSVSHRRRCTCTLTPKQGQAPSSSWNDSSTSP
ncbi:hypothetical protein ACFXJM_23360 [Streptomyces massasporeus]